MTRPVVANAWDALGRAEPPEPPHVSVVITHFEQQTELDRTLHALRRQTHPADRLEVIVVDDGSRRPPRVPAGVMLLRQDDRGFRAGRARNLGAAASRGRVLCFLDADSSPVPGYVQAAVRLPAMCPDVVVVGRRRHADLTGISVFHPIERLGPAHALGDPDWLGEAYAASRNLLDADDRSYRFVIGAALTCSAALWRVVGGFDETFTTYGGEDLEWAYRAWLHGAALAHEPAAVVWHDGPDWAGRVDDADQRARKLDETLRLSIRVPELGARGRGLHYARPDTVIRLPAGLSATEAVVTLDGLLAAVPDAVAVVPADVARLVPQESRVVVDGALAHLDVGALPPRSVDGRELTHVRHVLDVRAACRVDPCGLAEEIASLPSDVGGLTWATADGDPLLALTRLRARRREARWPGHRLFGHRTARSTSVAPVPEDQTVEGWFAGW